MSITADNALSPAEAFVLLSLPRYDSRKALKLALMGLLAQRRLRMESEDRPGVFRIRHIVHLHVAADALGGVAPIEESLLRVVRAAEPAGLMADVVKQSMRQYGKALLGFVGDYVGPALVRRGLAEVQPTRLLGIIPTTRFVRTAAGEAEKIRLENAMREARTIPQFLDCDLAQAVALAAAPGGALLLVEELQPHYRAIAEAMRQRGDFGDVPISDGGSFDFGIGFDLASADFSAVDFGSFDAGFSDAGGDGGGGDGGSSGC